MSLTIPHWTEGPLPQEPSARIICDSISESGHRITTIEARFHRFCLAEFNTHTLFSRNSASSRAVPLRSKTRPDGSNPRNGTLDRLEDFGPAFPIRWPKEKPGMQGADEEVDIPLASVVWEAALQDAIFHAEELAALGLHKSLANRLLEPFTYHVACITAVDWEGFFKQRSWNHTKLVQPEFGTVATMIEDQMAESEPELLLPQDWHLPWVRPDEKTSGEFTQFELCKLSSARNARVSYMTHDGVRDPEADFSLFDNLHTASPPHASPFQHVATPEPRNEYEYTINPADYGFPDLPVQTMKVPIIGNARGYMQFRHVLLGM